MKEFKIFGLPPEVDEFLTLGFLIIFLLSVTINYNVCGGGAVAVYKDKYSIELKTNLDKENAEYINFRENFVYFIQQQTNMYFKQSNKGFWFGMFLYWVAVPILCYYYAFFRFKKGMWQRAKEAEDLYNSVYYNNNRGDLK